MNKGIQAGQIWSELFGQVNPLIDNNIPPLGHLIIKKLEMKQKATVNLIEFMFRFYFSFSVAKWLNQINTLNNGNLTWSNNNFQVWPSDK